VAIMGWADKKLRWLLLAKMSQTSLFSGKVFYFIFVISMCFCSLFALLVT
jgi:hypothetical protein